MLVRFVLELFSYRNDLFSAGVFVQGKQGPLLHEFDEDDLVNKAVCNKYILNTANESITGSVGFCQNEKEGDGFLSHTTMFHAGLPRDVSLKFVEGRGQVHS